MYIGNSWAISKDNYNSKCGAPKIQTVYIYCASLPIYVGVFYYYLYYSQPVLAFSFVSVWLPLFYFAKTSEFAKYHLLLVELPIILCGVCSWLMYRNDMYIGFQTRGYYGVVDELRIGRQGSVMLYIYNMWLVVLFWIIPFFCATSTVLYIKFHRQARIQSTYMNQLSATIVSVFAGLLDYLTDILLVFYWITNKFYVYAIIEASFVVFAQIATSYLIKDVPMYADYTKTAAPEATTERETTIKQHIKSKC